MTHSEQQSYNDSHSSISYICILKINNAGIISVTNLDEGPNHLETLIKVNLLGVILV